MLVNRVVAYLFLPVFGFGFLCPYFVFYVQRQHIKGEAIKAINTCSFENKVTLHFSSYEFKHLEWLEENEFYYQGSRYDLIRKNVDRNGDVNLICVDDKHETHFFANFSKLIHENNSPFGGAAKSVHSKCFFDDFLKNDFQSCFGISSLCFDIKNCFLNFSCPLSYFFGDVTTPPPR